jgi:hypothetical protein
MLMANHTKEELDMLKQELQKLQNEISSIPTWKKICKYRECKQEFETDDMRIEYCKREHYQLENLARTREKNMVKRKTQVVDAGEIKGV